MKWNSFQKEDCHFLTAHWTYVWVHNRSNMPMFCLKNSFLSPGWSQIRHLCPRWPSPSVLACLNLNLTQWHPLVAKFSNMCHFRHFLRVPRKTWPKSESEKWREMEGNLELLDMCMCIVKRRSEKKWREMTWSDDLWRFAFGDVWWRDRLIIVIVL